jgi:hypothetical protein
MEWYGWIQRKLKQLLNGPSQKRNEMSSHFLVFVISLEDLLEISVKWHDR